MDISSVHSSANSWITSMEPMRLHGSLMIIAWVGLAHIGTLSARYLRFKQYWFRLHIFLQLAAVVLNCVAFGLIIAHVEQSAIEKHKTAHHFNNLHKASGLVVTTLAILQILVGLLSHVLWYPGKPVSAVDRWHWYLGKYVMLAAWGTVLTGFMQLLKEGYKTGVFLNIIIAIFFGLLLLVGGMIEVHLLPDSSQNTANVQERVPLLRSSSQLEKATAALFFYMAVILLISSAMVVGLYINLEKV